MKSSPPNDFYSENHSGIIADDACNKDENNGVTADNDCCNKDRRIPNTTD